MVRKHVFLACVATLAFVASVAGSSRAQSNQLPIEVTYGVNGASAAEWPLYIAQSQGYFRDEGLHVTLVQMGSPPNLTSALATNAVNFGDMGTDSLISAIEHGLSVKAVASGFITNPYSLVTPPSIKSWADLKGKAISLGTKQDVTAIAFEQMAAAHGLGIDDFSIVIGGNSPTRYAALQSGNVQGALLAQPFDLLAESQGMHVFATSYQSMKDWIFICISVNDGWAAANRPAVVKTLRALHRAVDYGYAHKDAAIAMLVAGAHVDPGVAQGSYELDFTKWHAFDSRLRIVPAWLTFVGKKQMEMGILPAVPSNVQIYDPSFVTEAVR